MVVGRLAALVCVGVLAFSACGDDGSGEPETLSLDETTPAATEEAPSPTPTDTGPVPEDPIEGEFARGASAAKGEEQLAVGEVWFSYWDELLRMYRTGESDRDAVYELAADTAASGPLDYAADMQAAGNKQVGGAIGAITKVTVDGDTATVIGCFRNTTVDVDDAGEPVEQAHVFFTTKDTLRREGPDWRVAEQLITSEDAPCDYR